MQAFKNNRRISGAGLLFSVGLMLVTLACGKTESKFVFESSPKPFSSDENAAAAAKGARPIASDDAGPGFLAAHLNDGTDAAWGSAESRGDTYAAVILAAPQAIREYRLSLFSPDQPPRAHLLHLRVVAADSEGNPPAWRVVHARLAKDQPFSEKVIVPQAPDRTVVQVEIDSSDPNAGPHKIWGFACFTASRGDERNYLPPGAGNGIYVRELQMK